MRILGAALAAAAVLAWTAEAVRAEGAGQASAQAEGQTSRPGACEVPDDGRIHVRDRSSGCFHHAERADEWVLDGGLYRCGSRALSARELESIRRTVLEAPEHLPGGTDELLASVGVTRATVAAHRDTILATALPPMWKERGMPEVLPDELEALLTYDALAPTIESELLSRNWGSTSSLLFEVVLPGDPPVTVRSEGLVPWMLPWTITAGERTWTSPDVRISIALLELADPDGPCRSTLDGCEYWGDGFYRDESFWRRFVGTRLDAALSEERYVKLAGFDSVTRRFEIDQVMTGHVNLLPESMFFTLSARYPSLVDGARWYNLLERGEPTSTWEDFERAIAVVQAAAQRHPWLAEWKHAGPERSLHAEIVGDRCHGERKPELFVTPAWRDAGLPGEPEIELDLLRNGKPCGTLWLSSRSPRVLIARMKPGEGEHWLDALDVSFHPKTPTYARVGPDGPDSIVELRTIGETPEEGPR